MKQYRIYQVDSFTTEKLEGNPAGVVANADGLNEAQMQAIARELNNSETAFILSPAGPDHEVWVRFFTPTTEVPSCGHATIAAHYVRAVELDLEPGEVMQKIGIGVLPVGVGKVEGDYFITMTQGRPEFVEPIPVVDSLGMLEALDLGPGGLDERCPVQIVSTGHSKVMIGIRDRARLHTLKPDMAQLTNISERIGCSGYHVFTLDAEPGYLAHGRMFAPAIGIPEDPVTGNGNGPLGAYLVHHGLAKPKDGVLEFKARQGEAMGRPGTVHVRVKCEGAEPVGVQVGGRAVVVLEAVLEV